MNPAGIKSGGGGSAGKAIMSPEPTELEPAPRGPSEDRMAGWMIQYSADQARVIYFQDAQMVRYIRMERSEGG